MSNALRLYRRFLGISLRAQMEYRASFLMQSLGNFLITGVEFLLIWALYDRFGQVPGWSLAEVALLYGLVNTSFPIAEVLSYGFDAFGSTVKAGEFDRVLLRPRSLVLQLIGQRLALKNVGRFLQGLAVLSFALSGLSFDWSAAKVLLILLALVGGVALFFGLIVLQATLAFWTTESLEVMNTMTYGGAETAQFPLSIYPAWLRTFFIFVVPLGCVTYLPVLAVLDRPAPAGLPDAALLFAPGVAFVFLAVALRAFQFGVGHYTSTGS
ncbi:MAG: ABC-2 family transporter protein [Planctomycetes bacterium]|nr:ABC-2 family transporter protein [Planctomycetota bacterium]